MPNPNKVTSSEENNTPTRATNRFLAGIITQAIRQADSIVNRRDIWIFERILEDILSKKRMRLFDVNESYYEKIELLQDFPWEIILLSDGGSSYRVQNQEHIIFTRGELEKIGKRFTELEFPELRVIESEE